MFDVRRWMLDVLSSSSLLTVPCHLTPGPFSTPSPMRRPILIILSVIATLAAIEGLAWWWMNPPPAGLGDPILAYRPKGSAGVPPANQGTVGLDRRAGPLVANGAESQESEKRRRPVAVLDRSERDVPQRGEGAGGASESNQGAAACGPETDASPAPSTKHKEPGTSHSSSTAHRSLLTDHSSSSSSTDNGPRTTDNSPSSPNLQSPISNLSSITPLPEVVSRSIPSLRCSSGIAARIDRPDGITVHAAFFEWDRQSSTNVLEAFKHLPDECMGAIGMTLVKKHPPRTYVVRGQETGDRGQRTEARSQGAGDRDQETVGPDRRAGRDSANGANSESTATQSPPSTKHQGQGTNISSPSSPNLESPISNIPSSTLTFDHTEFLDPTGKPVHAFKGVWVSGAANLLGDGTRGGVEQWNQLRWKAALKRFRPAHARTAQGAVRGIANPDRAWEIFQESMLRDLTFEQ